MKLKGIGHVGINAGDYSKSLVFYRDILGLEEIGKVEWPEFSITNLKAPDGTIVELFDYGFRKDKAQSDNSVVGYRHLAFLVEDVDAFETLLKDKDVPIKLHATVMEDLGIKGMLCLDPDGTEVELYEYL